MGGSIIIHIFGAFFGLSCSYFSSPVEKITKNEGDQGSTKESDLFSMIGTIFLFM